MTEAQAKHINMIKQFTTYHVFRFAKCNKEGHVYMRGKEWGRQDVYYPWEPPANTPLLLGYVLNYMLIIHNTHNNVKVYSKISNTSVGFLVF